MVLLEREAHVETLDMRLAEAERGRGSLVVIAGEAGVGKSALVDAFCRQQSTSVAMVRGGCDALGTTSPLGPLHDIVRSGGERDDLRGVAQVLRADGARHRIFGAVLDWLAGAAGPTVVVIEDLHWADEATLDLVVYLGRRVIDTGAMVVVTLRDEDTPDGLRVRAILGTLATAVGVHRLDVPPLSRAAVGELAASSDVMRTTSSP